jgi:hypothetical protein
MIEVRIAVPMPWVETTDSEPMSEHTPMYTSMFLSPYFGETHQITAPETSRASTAYVRKTGKAINGIISV